MDILVIDIGGSHVKFAIWGRLPEKKKFDSSDHPSAYQVVKRILDETKDWKYDAVSVGFPGTVMHGRIRRASSNLGRGWLNFDFERHFHKPVKVINDAAMQALGSYRGGRMLFLGLGTGVGSSLILDGVIIPLELSHLNYTERRTVGEVLGKKSLRRYGAPTWERAVHKIVGHLSLAFQTDYVAIGGGNVKRLKRLPRCARRGHNDNAFIGGARLWGHAGVSAHARKHTWVIA
jgi:polyphosphate glucokinase